MWYRSLYFSLEIYGDSQRGFKACAKLMLKGRRACLGTLTSEFKHTPTQFSWDPGCVFDSTQKEYLELRAQKEIENALIEANNRSTQPG